jgi:hypothetical protein
VLLPEAPCAITLTGKLPASQMQSVSENRDFKALSMGNWLYVFV